MPTVNRQIANEPAKTKKQGVLERIAPIGFDDEDGLKVLLYGRSATGKTTLWATFPGPILVAICSGGNKPGELRSVDTPEYRKKIKKVDLQHSSELKELVDHQKETGNYATMVLDHATGFQDLILKEVLGLDEVPVAKNWGLAQQQDYGTCIQQCKEHFRALLSLDCNVVIVAQERVFGDENHTGMIDPVVGAGLFPKLAEWLHPAADYVGQTFIRQKEITKKVPQGVGPQAKMVDKKFKVAGQVEYCLRTAPHDVYMTKFRVPKGHKLPPEIVDPDYQKMYDVIKGIENGEISE